MSSLCAADERQFLTFLDGCQPGFSGKSSMASSGSQTAASSSKAAGSCKVGQKRKRTLERHVSVDTEGYPKIESLMPSDSSSGSPEEPEQDQCEGEGAEEEARESDPVVELDDSKPNPAMLARLLLSLGDKRAKIDSSKLLQQAESKAKKPVPAARGAQKAAILQKRPAAKVEHSKKYLESKRLGKLKPSFCGQKSYICHQKDGKWVHIVSVYEKNTVDHAMVVQKLCDYLVKHSVGKEEINAVKRSWLKQLDEGLEVKDLGSDCEPVDD